MCVYIIFHDFYEINFPGMTICHACEVFGATTVCRGTVVNNTTLLESFASSKYYLNEAISVTYVALATAITYTQNMDCKQFKFHELVATTQTMKIHEKISCLTILYVH